MPSSYSVPPPPPTNLSSAFTYALGARGRGYDSCFPTDRPTDQYRYRYGDTDMRPSRLMLRIGRYVSKHILSVHTDMVREPHSASRACIYSVLVLVYCHCAPWYIRIRMLSWSWLMALLSWFKLRYLLGSIVHTCDDFDGCLGLAIWDIKLYAYVNVSAG